jgi:hypothetical protein
MKRARLFICHVIPKGAVERYPACQAGNQFSFTLIDDGLFDRVFSMAPTQVREPFEAADSVEYISMWRRFRLLPLKLLGVGAENVLLLKKVPRDAVVWFYNVTWQTLGLFWLLRLFRPRVKVGVIVADFTPPVGLDPVARLCQRAIHRADFTIPLAASERFKSGSSICLPGVVPDGPCEGVTGEPAERSFLLSGILVENRGFPMLLEWFAKHPRCCLHVSGVVPAQEVLDRYTQRYANICDHGFLSREAYRSLLQRVTFCLNTRDPRYPENRENFPSKMIEYLLMNKVVVSTMTYPQLEGVDYLYVPLEEEAFMGQLEALLEMSADELAHYSDQGDRIRALFSTAVWRQTMEQLENRR